LPAIALTFARDVEAEGSRYLARTGEPWLKLEIDAALWAGRWVRIVYASGLLDPLVRPRLRVRIGAAFWETAMPAALHGRGVWRGAIPKGATEVWISPIDRAGPFSFRVEQAEIVARVRVWTELFAKDPVRGVKFALAGAFGHEELALIQARRVLCVTPVARYDAWRRERWRPFERESFDLPPSEAGPRPHFRVVAGGDASEIVALRRRLEAQPYPDWSLTRADETIAGHAGGLRSEDWLLPLAAGDILASYALDAFAAEAGRRPVIDVLYGDEDSLDKRGRWTNPRLKPDWSPIFQAAAPYLGAAVAIRARLAAKFTGIDLREIPRALGADVRSVFHIRRVLLTRSDAAPIVGHVSGSEPPPGAPIADVIPQASIVIPTRDRLELLRTCVASLWDRTSGVKFELVVIDNGSVEPTTLAYLDALAGRPNCRVIRDPGPFNYSRLCNRAAREARAPFLVFMNNDTECAREDWLSRMLPLAARPDVGAVGAKLLYRDGSVQHAGVVMGIDGRAAHFQRRVKANDPGYFGSLGAPHEVSAVTAACLAIESRKFAAIGGFDETNLPIELNDVDLCLRLNARGWKTILEPRAIVLHLESASRGVNTLLDARYRAQHDYFVARWAHVLRDDPYFHPALSLDTLGAGLG
jgi:GT2 family glycosyltransferase